MNVGSKTSPIICRGTVTSMSQCAQVRTHLRTRAHALERWCARLRTRAHGLERRCARLQAPVRTSAHGGARVRTGAHSGARVRTTLRTHAHGRARLQTVGRAPVHDYNYSTNNLTIRAQALGTPRNILRLTNQGPVGYKI